jgi:hypothetical protein
MPDQRTTKSPANLSGGESGLSPRTAAAAAREKRVEEANVHREGRRSRSPAARLEAELQPGEEVYDTESAVSDGPPTGQMTSARLFWIMGT